MNHPVDKLGKLTNDIELLANILSHDFKKPLRAINNASTEFQHNNVQLDHNAKEFIRAIDSATKDINIMVEAILEYLRLEVYPLELSPINCHDVVEEVIGLKHDLIAENKAVIKLGILPTVMGYKKKLIYLFSELIENAIKFKRQDLVPVIEINASCNEDICSFSISDNGIAIEEEYFEVIFLLFQRLHTREEIPGYGIGLALCNKIVEASGGKMWVESTANEGGRFCFTLTKA
jgi:light-regulated signal transduction histidine kinase (bacteriophytochrome)